MCSICLRTPCAAGCPNAPEPKAIDTCKHCGEGIVAGEEYVELDGEYYHEECLSDIAMEVLLEKFDTSVKEAEEPDGYGYF
ncbi:MAG: hypothetical protein LIO94_02875 [Clostridiales bacterium]|nr:hypothetical protein [Clostridiales bacterium]